MRRCIVLTIVVLTFGVASISAADITMMLSGQGAVNDTTIKAGQPVSIDVVVENDTVFTGFTMGFKLTSPDLAE
ncbi:MAG: hypothetical protein IMY80_06910, partial [Chloroflexi bacterium]|nr:hypothetical protein [Chloroflexota bacterium]